jgi:hypothetical protein
MMPQTDANSRTQGNAAKPCITIWIAIAGCLIIAERGAGQERVDPISETVAQSFTMIQRSFIDLANAMPAEKYDFKPTNGEFKDVRTFGQHVKHVACTNFAFFNEIEKKPPPDDCGRGGPNPATTKAGLMAYLRESFAYGERVLRTLTPANALEPTGGWYGGTNTRLGLSVLAVWHASDHYGQLVVYLRMNGIVPPASQTPTEQSTSPAIATVFKDGGAYGSVARVELPFGNLDTTFRESDFRSLGIGLGDHFQVRCREKTFDILLERDFRDVSRGEWVALISPQGVLKIARSFASAAETSGCKPGDNMFVSKVTPRK